MSSRAPSEQEKLFSQADARIVQRPFGVDSDGVKPVVPAQDRVLEQYSPPRATPGRFDEITPATNNSTVIGGTTLLVDKELGFNAHSVVCDNWTNQWLQIDGVRRYINPYSGGWVLNNVSGMQQGRVALKTPSVQILQQAPLAGEYVYVAFAEALLPPATGVFLPAGSVTGTLPTFVDTVGGTNRTYVDGASGNVANAAAVATLPANATQRTWITGFELTALGSTGVLVVLATVVGVVNGPLTYVFLFPAGVTTQAQSLIVEFPFPIPTAAVNTAITVTLPAGGAGNTNAAAVAHGFQEL